MPDDAKSLFCNESLYIAGLSSSKITLDRGISMDQLEDVIVSQYPHISLAMVGFTFARADKGRRLQHFDGSTTEQLEAFIGKGKLIVIPKRDLPVPSPTHPQEVSMGDNVHFAITVELCS